jgi:hypothetical protein
MKSPVALLSSLLHDVERLEPGVKGLDRDLHTIKVRFENEGYGFLTIALPTLCDALDRGLADGKYTCPTGFSCKGALPKFLSGLLCAVFDTKTGLILDNPSVSCVKLYREITRMFKKLMYSDSREEILHKKAVHEFMECDNVIPDDIYSPEYDYYLTPVSRMILQGLHNYDPRNIKAKHGPGSVAESHSPNQKWQGVLSDMLKHDEYASSFGFDAFISDSVDDQPKHSLMLIEDEDELYNAPAGVAKLITVPKSSVARRTISMEPVLKQFIQQGLNTELREEISRCPILQGCLALASQERNQIACLEGSISGEISTIDLSAASDRLSLRLVERVFASKALFLEDLKRSRSRYIEIEGSRYNLRKYAGMGNATTFPVQSVTFALLAICSILSYEGSKPSYRSVLRASRLLRVFGDDITIPSKYVASLDRWLTYYGLKINHKKSFTTGFFRESCGVDAFHGQDVTPLYVKSLPSLLRGKSDLIPHLVSISNASWMRGLYEFSTTVRMMVEGLVGPLPLGSINCGGLVWHSRVDTSVAQKWDEKLQQFVFRTLVVKGTRTNDPLSGRAALLKSLVNLNNRPIGTDGVQDKRNLESSPKRFRNRLRWRWLPTRVG